MSFGSEKKIQAARAELASIQSRIDACRSGSANLDRYRESLLASDADIRRWQSGFSDPMEAMPGGRELLEEDAASARRAFADLEDRYLQAKAEYAKVQKGLESELSVKKKELALSAEKEKQGGGV